MPLEILTHVQSLGPLRGNSLCKNTSHDVQIISDWSTRFFAQLTLLPNPPKSYALPCLSIGHAAPKVPLPTGHLHPHEIHVL